MKISGKFQMPLVYFHLVWPGSRSRLSNSKGILRTGGKTSVSTGAYSLYGIIIDENFDIRFDHAVRRTGLNDCFEFERGGRENEEGGMFKEA